MKAPTYADAQAIAKDIIDRYVTDGIDVVHLAYANFRSTLVQEPTVDQIIPVAAAAPTARTPAPASLAAVEYEPDEEEILADLSRATSRCRSIARCWRTRPASTARR